jgi:hypothetical protein
MTRSYKQWSTNDYALMIYARYKGLSNKQIGQLLDISANSVGTQFYSMKNPFSLSKKKQAIINKAEVLESQVRSGLYPDHRTKWDAQLSQITNITYTYVEQEKTEDVEQDEQEAAENVESPRYSDLLTIRVDMSAVLRIIKALRG